MKRPKSKRVVYLRAAEHIAAGYCKFCSAVSDVDPTWSARTLYAVTMANRHGRILNIMDIYRVAPTDDKARDFRILLLCMMAACCDDMEV